jgi:hypothetical protein
MHGPPRPVSEIALPSVLYAVNLEGQVHSVVTLKPHDHGVAFSSLHKDTDYPY